MGHQISKKVFWCRGCNVPVLTSAVCPLCGGAVQDAMVGNGELRPVFEAEKKWYRELLTASGKEPERYLPENLCFYHRGSVLVDGQKVFRVKYNLAMDKWEIKIFRKFQETFPILSGSVEKRVIEANKEILRNAEFESLTFLGEAFRRYRDWPKAVSFSGGKDSVVCLFLARQLMPKIDVIYLNTTVGFPETEMYVRKLAQEWNLSLFEVKPIRDFFELCGNLGPPSKFMKWCCKTQKFAPMNQLIETRYGQDVFVVSGLRREESRSRRFFKRIQRNGKIPKQTLVFPILEWNTLMVWLYISWKDIPINPAYNHGFSRMGCWVCPEKSLKKLKLIEKAHPTLVTKFHAMLRKFAKKEGIKDIDDWIGTAKWRLRASKYKREFVKVSNPCALNDQQLYTIEDRSKIRQVAEFMKVFGEANGSEDVTRIRNRVVEISIIGNKVRTEYLNDSPRIRKIVRRQLERALNCVQCGACLGSCKLGSLRIEDSIIRINSDCVHCLECLGKNGLRKGCISLNYRPDQLSIKTKEGAKSHCYEPFVQTRMKPNRIHQGLEEL